MIFSNKHASNTLARALKRTCGVLGVTGLAAFSLNTFAACTYNIDNEWNTGFVANITIKNDTGSAINNWNLNWQYTNNRITSSWNTNLSGTNPYTATNISWNGNIAAGQSVSFGFQGDKNGSSAERPSINGSVCGGGVSSVSSAPRSSSAPNSSVASTSRSSSSAPSNSSSSYSAPANNFAQNGGVESNLTNWSTTAGTPTRVTDEKHSGSASVLISGRTANWHGLTFNVGSLVSGSQYDVGVWVKLAPGAPDSVIQLTAKRQDDSDSSTYNEYTQVAVVNATSSEWRFLQGIYTQAGTTAFQHFIIESTDTTVSYYADDFSIVGQVPTSTSSSSRSSSSTATTTKKFIGNITTNGAVRSDFATYWNQITPENEGKWGSVEATRGVYNWTALDRIYTYARQNNIQMKAHTFVWGSQYPSWINNLSPSEQAKAIEDWIRNFCTRYPDIKYIDVVNEAIPGHAPAAYAQRAFGDNWIIKSFQLARQYCPNATLILNDYNVLSWDTDKFIALAKPVIAAGVVDALGEQAHGLESFSAATVSSNLNKVAALGLPIYITEYDVAKTDDQAQLQIFQQQFPVFYNHPSVKGITIWGYVYGATWVTGSGLIQTNGTPRPAMTWLLNNYIKK
jgi:GH35 family endo-1,4-beta-xylanase